MFIILITIFSVFLWSTISADAQFSATAPERHREMLKFYESVPSEEVVPLWSQPYLTGNWAGSRSKLARDGVTVSAVYVSDFQGVTNGGRARGVAYAGSLGLDIDINLGRYVGLQDTHLYVSGVSRWGTNLSTKKIGSAINVAQVYGGENIRLNELLFHQYFQNGDYQFKVGRIDTANDFIQSNLFYYFLNNGIDGTPVAVFKNGPFGAYPNASWGFSLKFRVGNRVLGRFGVIAANSTNGENKYHGFNWTLKTDAGTQFLTEWKYSINELVGDTGLPGNYRLGYFYYSGQKGQKFLGGNFKGNYGYYFMVDQMIYRVGKPEEKRGITPFLTMLFAPQDRNQFPFFFVTGAVAQGLIPSRPSDSTNIVWIYGKWSKDLSKAQQTNRHRNNLASPFGMHPQNFESILEISHWFYVTDAIQIVPDFQYIMNPNGEGNLKSATVYGVQIGLTF